MNKPARKSKKASVGVLAPTPQPSQAVPVKPTAAPVALLAPIPPAAPKLGFISIELVEPSAREVYVAGSFNGWRPDCTPLIAQGNGRWKGNLELGPGRYEYLFVVDGQWRPDPNAHETVQNPFGGKNSVMMVAQ